MDCSYKAKDSIKDFSDPDKLLCEYLSKLDVTIVEDNRDYKAEDKEYNSIYR